jgi:hypothetical protein
MAARLVLPWRRFTLETGWTPSDVERELGRLLDGSRATDGTPWHGWRSGRGFEFRRAIGTGAVVVAGKVDPAPNGSRVAIVMRPPTRELLVFFVLVPLLALLSLAASAAALVRREGFVLLVWFAPLLMGRHVLHRFLLGAHAAEGELRRIFPPVAPPHVGPFR